MLTSLIVDLANANMLLNRYESSGDEKAAGGSSDEEEDEEDEEEDVEDEGM